ncbi:MAG TPA: carboxypeptidase-like regulatory domain-containing protein [Candidatus Limnocylindria bacterium]
MSLFRHRHLVYLPFLVLLVATVIGGWVNTVDLHGRVVDDFTSDPIGNASIQLGDRSVNTGGDGQFDFPNLPKTSSVQVDANGYTRTHAPTTQEEIRLTPIALTVYVNEAGVTPAKGIAKATVRQGDTPLGTTNDSGQTVISPYPGKGDAQLLICADGHDPKTVVARGVIVTVELAAGTNTCPPLPTPSPAVSPSASPAASPTAPAPSPSPSPTP